MSNTEDKKMVEEYIKTRKTISMVSIASAVVAFILMIFTFIPFNQISYDNRFEELYEHQYEYIMNETQDFDDVFDRDEFCNFVEINFEQGGKWIEQDGVVYFQDLKIEFTNHSNRNFTELSISLLYEDYNGESGQFDVTIGDVGAGSIALKELKMPRLCKVKKVCLVSESRISNAVCYAIERGAEMLTPFEAGRLIDITLITALIGERPEPILSGTIKYLIAFILCVISLGAIIISKLIADDIARVKRGEFVVEEGKIKPNRTTNKIIDTIEKVIEEVVEEEEVGEKSLKETEKTLPSDFDDGHETNHDCGGFDIKEDDFKIDPNNYK